MNIAPGSHIHMMGICGTAMASLAGLLKDRGYHVTGSDSNPYPPMSTQIESLGIKIQRGYKKENLVPKPDFVIVGNVISAGNEEAQEMMRLQVPYTSLPKAMGEFIIENRESIVISGTHGKTTTTSMMTYVSDQCGLKPGFLIGGIPKNYSQSFRNPVGNFFVIEGDEYDTAFFDKVPKFIHYKPRHVILTSVEFDHADIYKDLAAVKDAFSRLVSLIPANGHLVYNYDDGNVRELATKCKGEKISYGFHTGADYRAEVVELTADSTVFQVYRREQSLGYFKTRMSGNYNVLNALSVIAMSSAIGLDLVPVAKALTQFEGVKRRQEILGEPNGILVIEDFAHHPTAVRETVRGLKARYKGRKLFSVFEPRSATSRRKVFQKDYVEAFMESEETLLAKAFDQSKISEEDRFSSEELISDLVKDGKKARVCEGAEAIVDILKKEARSGDVILIMSNGGFDGIYTKLLTALKNTQEH